MFGIGARGATGGRAVRVSRVEAARKEGLQRPAGPQPSAVEGKRRQAAELEELASRGMFPKRYRKEAARLRMEAEEMEVSGGGR